MALFAIRRLIQAVFTVFGVMLLTFILFNIVPGDPSQVYVNVQKEGPQKLQEWRERHNYDKPLLLNFSERLRIYDLSEGRAVVRSFNPQGSRVATALGMNLAKQDELPSDAPASMAIETRGIQFLDAQTSLSRLAEEEALVVSNPAPQPSTQEEKEPSQESSDQPDPTEAEDASEDTPSQSQEQPAASETADDQEHASDEAQASPTQDTPAAEPTEPQPNKPLLGLELSDGSSLVVDLSEANTVGDLQNLINNHPFNDREWSHLTSGNIIDWQKLIEHVDEKAHVTESFAAKLLQRLPERQQRLVTQEAGRDDPDEESRLILLNAINTLLVEIAKTETAPSPSENPHANAELHKSLPRSKETLGYRRALEDLADEWPGVFDISQNGKRVQASISDQGISNILDSQFFHHIYKSVTFTGLSYQWEDKTLLTIIKERAKYSLALTIPQLALGWFVGLLISSIVAYWRGTWIDHVGVFLAVLGMCIPYLAYILFGQLLMFHISPKHAWGLSSTYNIYIPVMIGAVAGVGASVRFYRTVILDQVGQDYVRTARAKGVPLPSILGKHVLRNCMLPILTSLVMSIPFLILGSLLLEQFFGIPGLGDLLITSINSKDVPVITGLTFLTAVVYVLGLLITDLLYGIFDPRIRLK